MQGGGGRRAAMPPTSPTTYVPGEAAFCCPFSCFPAVVSESTAPEQGRRPAPLAPPFSTSFRTDTSDFITRCSRRQED